MTNEEKFELLYKGLKRHGYHNAIFKVGDAKFEEGKDITCELYQHVVGGSIIVKWFEDGAYWLVIPSGDDTSKIIFSNESPISEEHQHAIVNHFENVYGDIDGVDYPDVWVGEVCWTFDIEDYCWTSDIGYVRYINRNEVAFEYLTDFKDGIVWEASDNRPVKDAGTGRCKLYDFDGAEWANNPFSEPPIDPVETNEPDERKHKHYFKDVRHLDFIDVYRVIDLWEVSDPCLQHIIKKCLAAGKRGHKDEDKDFQDIFDSAARALEMRNEDKNEII